MAFALVAFFIPAMPAEAQDCRESCLQWCASNRNTERCRADCAGRESCRTKANRTGGLRGSACINWCNKNRPVDTCYADCRSR